VPRALAASHPDIDATRAEVSAHTIAPAGRHGEVLAIRAELAP
jgi:hypothetical protein